MLQSNSIRLDFILFDSLNSKLEANTFIAHFYPYTIEEGRYFIEFEGKAEDSSKGILQVRWIGYSRRVELKREIRSSRDSVAGEIEKGDLLKRLRSWVRLVYA